MASSTPRRVLGRACLIALVVGLCAVVAGPQLARPVRAEVRMIQGAPAILRAGAANPHTAVPPPDLASTPHKARFEVHNVDLVPVAEAPFAYAANIWTMRLASPVPIAVSVDWAPLDTDVLVMTTPRFVADFDDAPQANTWYPAALANKASKHDLLPTDDDMLITFNSNSAWYWGIDGATPSGQYDFATAVLHALTQGLGFAGSMQVTGDQGSWGIDTLPFIFDRDTTLWPNPSVALGRQLQGDKLYFGGSQAMSANGLLMPKLYVPARWLVGSSFGHLDEATYPAGNPNSLMTYQLDQAEAIHDPGALVWGMLSDLGWDGFVAFPTASPLPTPRPDGATPTPRPTATTKPGYPAPGTAPAAGLRVFLPLVVHNPNAR